MMEFNSIIKIHFKAELLFSLKLAFHWHSNTSDSATVAEGESQLVDC
jgi:hypothetical protein